MHLDDACTNPDHNCDISTNLNAMALGRERQGREGKETSMSCMTQGLRCIRYAFFIYSTYNYLQELDLDYVYSRLGYSIHYNHQRKAARLHFISLHAVVVVS